MSDNQKNNSPNDAELRFSLLELDTPAPIEVIDLTPAPAPVVPTPTPAPAPVVVTPPAIPRCTWGKIGQGVWGLRFADLSSLPPVGSEVIAIRRDGVEETLTVGAFAKNGRHGTVIAHIADAPDSAPADRVTTPTPEQVAADDARAELRIAEIRAGMNFDPVDQVDAPIVDTPVVAAPFVPDPATGAYAMLIGLAMWMAARCARPSANDRAIGGVFYGFARLPAPPAIILPTPAQMAADTRRIAAEAVQRGADGMRLNSADVFAGSATPVTAPYRSAYQCRTCATRENAIAFNGEAAEGMGLRIGVRGFGELTVPQMREAVVAAGLPIELAPTPKSARNHAGQVVSDLSRFGYICRVEKSGSRAHGAKYAARWHVGSARNVAKEVGGAFGRTILEVTLHTNATLTFVGDTDLANTVSAEYDRRCSNEVYKAAQVTKWVKDTLRMNFVAVDRGLSMYVLGVHAERAEQFAKAIEPIFGNWEIEPCATHAQVKDSLCNGLRKEVSELVTALDNARTLARSEGREDIQEGTAGRYVTRLEAIAKRVAAFSDLLGAERVADVSKVANDLLNSLSGLVSDKTKWAQMVADEMKSGPFTPSTNDTCDAFRTKD